MQDIFLFQNSLNDNENIIFNKNTIFQNSDSSNYNLSLFDSEINNEPYINKIEFKNNNIFQDQEEENIKSDLNINQDISSINQLPIQYQENTFDNYYNIFQKNQQEKNFQNFSCATSPLPPPSPSLCPSPLDSTKGTGDKNKSKETSILSDKDKNIKPLTTKKRKQRIHLEDLNIDPEIIKYKKYQTIGDKVITSKNSKITDLDRKEIRAIRNRISAQKSRDRKKAEFNNLQMRVKFFEELIKKQNLIIKDFERISCPECKSKFTEIKLNISLEQNYEEKEYLVLDEDASFSTDKKSSVFGKLTGALITLVCLIGIILCCIDGRFIPGNNNSNIKFDGGNNMKIYRNNDKITLRQLSENKALNNENDKDNDADIDSSDIKEESTNTNIILPVNPILDNGIDINFLRLYHDRFGIDIYSYLKKKKKSKNGFLMKKQLINETDGSMCIETKNIEHNNYIIDNNSLQNTLPVEASNIVIDNNLSHKIISLFVKDYNTLNRYINGKSLTLQEQIEIEAKNSEDGCVYLQMIIPNNKINDYDEDNKMYDNDSPYKNSFFEIRCKIFAYNNYYESKLAPTTTTTY